MKIKAIITGATGMVGEGVLHRWLNAHPLPNNISGDFYYLLITKFILVDFLFKD